ncbi:MAG: hypothetical protein A2Y55_03845, partial [Actinobacteria bacterium RBG_16_68_12]
MKSVSVVIADDEALVRQALGELMSAEPALELAGEAGDADGVIELARKHRPDVALVDVRMPGGGGPRAAREIKLCSPSTRVVALSAYSDRETVIEMVRAGAVGYVVKGSPGREVVDAILRSARGEGTLSAGITGDVVAELSHHLEREQHESESRRAQIDRIRRVLAEGTLTIVFQPIVRLTTGEMVGVEALSRFPDDLPDTQAWFKSAEAVGLQGELEIHAVQAALAHLPSLDDELYLAVNLSPKTLPVWPSIILEAGAKDRVVLELTEHARIDDYCLLEKAIADARADGARIAVDDVGAGFANLKHILHVAPDFIKLDTSLTRGIHNDRSRSALAKALVSFAGELG